MLRRLALLTFATALATPGVARGEKNDKKLEAKAGPGAPLAAAPASPKANADPDAGEVRAEADAPAPPATDFDEPSDEEVMAVAGAEYAEVIEITDSVPPGSVQSVGEEDLARFEKNDIHKVLGHVPGVYIREEDGYGLRPNIGMRGSGSERSAKIALMEDGVLIAPAPYSAPAAYYFPLVTRMSRVEVLKGPGAIKHGPNTVGGSLNLVTRPIPEQREIAVDVAGGSDVYGKAHATYGERWTHGGLLVEALELRTDGFKRLDGGGDTGFDKRDVVVKGQVNTSPLGSTYHQVDVKLGYSDEVSNETYTGLSDADFAADPYRRYAGTQLDRMEWDHWQAQVRHTVRVSDRVKVVTTGYRNSFSRAWAKLSAFAGDRSITDVLADPSAGVNAVFYAVLTGAADSSSEAEALIIGTNDRSYVSQGVQSTATLERKWLGWTHAIEVGARVHYDAIERNHFEDVFNMVGGTLMPSGADTLVTKDATGSALAWAGYAQNRVSIGDVRVTAGLRTEVVRTKWVDRQMPEDDATDTYSVLIPGGGAVYQVTPHLGLLAGVHKGFVPVAPGQTGIAKPEESVNYEAGMRYSQPWMSTEVIGFFSDYSNLKGTCSFSSGCASGQVDDEFDGGKVHVAGVEAQAHATWQSGWGVTVPVKLTYTLNWSEFQSSFASSNPQWGDVEVGDELPYLPRHQLAAETGVAGEHWELAAAVRHTSRMRDAAGSEALTAANATDASTIVDLAANYSIDDWGKAYLTVDNLFDQANIVSRRPFGARPGAPRIIILGYKNTF